MLGLALCERYCNQTNTGVKWHSVIYLYHCERDFYRYRTSDLLRSSKKCMMSALCARAYVPATMPGLVRQSGERECVRVRERVCV